MLRSMWAVGGGRKIAKLLVYFFSFIHFIFGCFDVLIWRMEWFDSHTSHMWNVIGIAVSSESYIPTSSLLAYATIQMWSEGMLRRQPIFTWNGKLFHFIRIAPKTIHHSALDNGNVDWHVTQFLFPSSYTAEHEVLRASDPRARCAQMWASCRSDRAAESWKDNGGDTHFNVILFISS